MKPKIKTAADAKNLMAEATTQTIEPVIERMLIAVEGKCALGENYVIVSSRDIPYAMHKKLCAVMRERGFDIVHTNDQRDGNFFTIRW